MSDISLAEISKAYGSFYAVDKASLHVKQGELVTILGPSGSGKTTLLNLVAGLTQPSAGRIHIGGRDVTQLPTGQRNVGLVFQSYALFPHMTVFNNIAFPLRVRRYASKDIEAAVSAALQTVRLDHLAERKPSQLSGGQQQRVALARAFVFEPEILLLDEPLGALDRKLREEVQVELRALQRKLGITTVLVTHDQEEALSLSDRIMVLNEGRVQQLGTPEEVYMRPTNRFVADFLGTANFLSGSVQGANGAWSMHLREGGSVACGQPPSSAREHCMIIRPEKLQLNAQDVEGPRATVRDTIYLGQTVKYVLDTAIGQEMVAVLPPEPRFSIGDKVTLQWNPEDTWFIDAQEA
ncbi:ABC transporter ATP-binding protein [Aquibaculum sediminis]|uniref:ABC transporter ATP-binding protein n=1 Tax=Aquibaculum sediminis TaxID=3231907 RepID=UPI003456D99E